MSYDEAIRECTVALGPAHVYTVGCIAGQWLLYARVPLCPMIYRIAAFGHQSEAEAAKKEIEARRVAVAASLTTAYSLDLCAAAVG